MFSRLLVQEWRRDGGLEQISLLRWRWEINWILGKKFGSGRFFPIPAWMESILSTTKVLKGGRERKCWCGSKLLLRERSERHKTSGEIRISGIWECSQPVLPQIRTSVRFLFISFGADFSTAECCILGLYWTETLLDQSNGPPVIGNFLLSSESLRRRIKRRRRALQMKLCTSSESTGATSPATGDQGQGWWKCGCEPVSAFTCLSRYCCLLCMKATLSKEKTRKNLWKTSKERKISFLSE